METTRVLESGQLLSGVLADSVLAGSDVRRSRYFGVKLEVSSSTKNNQLRTGADKGNPTV